WLVLGGRRAGRFRVLGCWGSCVVVGRITRSIREKPRNVFAGGPQDKNWLEDRNFVASLVEERQDGALLRGFNFDGGLVGFDFAEDLALVDGVPDGNSPFGDEAAFYGIALAGHDHFDCHECVPYA